MGNIFDIFKYQFDAVPNEMLNQLQLRYKYLIQ